MRKTILFLLTVTVVVMSMSSTVLADESADLKKKIVMDKKKLVVMENMAFTTEESEKFWPLYQKYQEMICTNNSQYGELITAYIATYKTMTDVEALSLIDDYYHLQEEHLAIMKEFADELKVIMPGQKVIRYLQIENRLNTVGRFELAKRIPMAAQ